VIIYIALGTAFDGADRLASISTGHEDYLLAFPDLVVKGRTMMLEELTNILLTKERKHVGN
jgi:hypothetical protein